MIAGRTVELVYFTGCPHAAAARANVEAAMRRVGQAPQWQEWNLEDPSVPTRVAGYPSPSVLVGGREIHGQSVTLRPPGLTCHSCCASAGADTALRAATPTRARMARPMRVVSGAGVER